MNAEDVLPDFRIRALENSVGSIEADVRRVQWKVSALFSGDIDLDRLRRALHTKETWTFADAEWLARAYREATQPPEWHTDDDGYRVMTTGGEG